MTDLSVIEPMTSRVKFCGRDVEFGPLKVGQIPSFARAIKPASGTIAELMAAGSIDAQALIAMIAEHGESFVEAVAIATGVPAAELNDSGLDELVALAVSAIKVNADFFKGRLTPAIVAAVKQIQPQPAANGGGPTL